jgi:DTW domain-containing protein YfiP
LTLSWCIRCRLLECICDKLPRLSTRTRFLLIRHVFERNRPSNTGHFARLALGCDLLEYGSREAPLDESRVPRGPGTYLLFPGATAEPEQPPERLIVLDGSWSQAGHMRQRLRALHGLPLISLSPRHPNRRRLRRPRDAQGMSTLEAIAAALARFEGEEVAAPLEALHDLIVDAKRHAGWPLA